MGPGRPNGRASRLVPIGCTRSTVDRAPGAVDASGSNFPLRAREGFAHSSRKPASAVTLSVSQPPTQESADVRLVGFRGESMKVDVRGAGDHPDAFWLWRSLEKRERLRERRVSVDRAGNQKERRDHCSYVFDRTEVFRADVEAPAQLRSQEGLQRRPQESELDSETVADGFFDGRIDLLQNQCLHLEGLGAQKRGRPSKRGADRRNRTGRLLPTQEGHRRRSIPRFEGSECDVSAGAFAVGLEVEQENRVARAAEKPSSSEHRPPVSTNAVEKNDCRSAGPGRR